jgi:hypothetical protein
MALAQKKIVFFLKRHGNTFAVVLAFSDVFAAQNKGRMKPFRCYGLF